MPKLEHLPSREEREENDNAEEVPQTTLRDLSSPRIVQWRQDSMRALHCQETNNLRSGARSERVLLGTRNERVLDGSQLFNPVYGTGALACQNLGPEGSEFVTSVTRYLSSSTKSGAVGRAPEYHHTSPELVPGLNSAGRRAYSVNSSEEVLPTPVSNTAYNLAARETTPSPFTMQFGTAQYVLPQPPPMATAAVTQPVPPLPFVGVCQAHMRGRSYKIQRIRRFASEPAHLGIWPQDLAAEDDEDDVFEEVEEQLAEGAESELVLLPPAQPVLEPVIRVHPAMQRRCSI